MHLSDLQLQRLLDNEGEPEALRIYQDHLVQCATCSGQYSRLAEVSALVQGSVPTADEFSSEGVFWADLASELGPQQQPRWAWLSCLPPLVLTILVAIVHWMLSLVMTAWGLGRAQVVPGLGHWLSERLAASGVGVLPWAEWLPGDALIALCSNVTAWWGALGFTNQNLLVSAVVLIVAVALMATMVLLSVSWAVCWREPASLNGSGGN